MREILGLLLGFVWGAIECVLCVMTPFFDRGNYFLSSLYITLGSWLAGFVLDFMLGSDPWSICYTFAMPFGLWVLLDIYSYFKGTIGWKAVLFYAAGAVVGVLICRAGAGLGLILRKRIGWQNYC
jgi:hypothetical protein